MRTRCCAGWPTRPAVWAATSSTLTRAWAPTAATPTGCTSTPGWASCLITSSGASLRRHPARARISTARSSRRNGATLGPMRDEATFRVKAGLAEMLKGGVIMDVVTPEQAKLAEDAGAAAVMALERVPADIRRDGGVARMSDPTMICGIQEAVTIPVMAKARIGHFAEAQVLEALEVDYIDESEVATPADASLVMQLGAEAVFVGSGIFKSDDPAPRAAAIVEATTHFRDPARVAKASEGIGMAMQSLETRKLDESQLLAGRGW